MLFIVRIMQSTNFPYEKTEGGTHHLYQLVGCKGLKQVACDIVSKSDKIINLLRIVARHGIP
jgi:hypothetical protein